MRYPRNSLTQDWSTHTEYQAIVRQENSAVYMAWVVNSAFIWMILYADDIAILCNNIDKLAEINILRYTIKHLPDMDLKFLLIRRKPWLLMYQKK